jgi:hypothetical protein
MNSAMISRGPAIVSRRTSSTWLAPIEPAGADSHDSRTAMAKSVYVGPAAI